MRTKVLVSAVALSFATTANAQLFEIFRKIGTMTNPTEAIANPASKQAAGGVEAGKVQNKSMTAKEIFAAKGSLSAASFLEKMGSTSSQPTPQDLLNFFKNPQGSGTGTGTGTGFLSDLAMRGLIKQITSNLSYTALDHLMSSMSENHAIMEKVTVDVPQVMALGQPGLQEDVMSVARYLAAMKASNLLVAESEKSLEQAKERYKKILIEVDQKSEALGAARMLVGDVFKLDEATLKVTKGPDLDYLRGFYGKGFKEVLKDPLASRIVSAELHAQTPGEFESIDLAEKEVAGHYQAYSKTVAGSLSMLAFTALFIGNVKSMGNKTPMHQLIVVPMALDGGKEVFDTIKSSVSAFGRNDGLVEGTFASTVNGKTTTGVSASELLRSLTTEQQTAFAKSLIGKPANKEQVSYLAQLNRRVNAYPADILDRIVDSNTRDNFAKTVYGLQDTDKFSFKLAFDGKAKNIDAALKPKDPRIKSRIYEEDFTNQEDEGEKLYAQIQSKVRSDFSKLTNQDLRRIIFVVANGEAMQIGDAYIRMEQPGLQGLADRREMLIETPIKQTKDAKPNAAPRGKQPQKPANKKPTPKA